MVFSSVANNRLMSFLLMHAYFRHLNGNPLIVIPLFAGLSKLRYVYALCF